MPETWDVAVIGGGPAGCRAAWAAARAGASVLLVERKRRLGALPHCAEFVPRALALEMDMPPRSRVQAVEGLETRLADRRRYLAAPGWILDRQVFDHALAQAAALAGAHVLAGAELLDLRGETLRIKAPGGPREIIAGAVVAADGAVSATARLFGLPRQSLLAGVQWEVPLARELGRTLVFLEPGFRGGYAWLFPKGGVGNLGVGCAAEAKPLAQLAMLQERLMAQGLIKPGVLARGGGAIPVSGPRFLSRGRLILAGDAAGLTHPVTGAGIPQALASGALAGRAAARAAGGEAGAGDEYARETDAHWGRYLARGLEARARLEAGWDGGDFTDLMAETWPGWGRDAD